MHYLPYLNSVDAEITIEKLDKVARTLSEKIKTFAKFFGILIGWCIFNILVALFIDNTRSLSLNTYRMISEGLRSMEMQDALFVLTLIFDNKIGCVISLAMFIAFETAFFVRFLNFGNECAFDKSDNKRAKDSHSSLQGATYVVSYKQSVAFLA